MKIRAIDFFSYEVADIKKSVEFYRDTLGLEMGMYHEQGWAEFDLPPSTLSLYCPKAMEGREPRSGGGTVWISVEDIDATVAELKGKGVNVLMDPFETPVCCMAIFTDPDGNHIGLHHRKDGTVG